MLNILTIGVMMSKGIVQPKTIVNKLNRYSWMAQHLRYYIYLNTFILSRGIPLKELLILKFPFAMKDAPTPPLLSIDITDACDLNCLYCNNPLFPHPRIMMNDTIVESLLKQLEKTPVNRIRIGGGEPTLHPKFASILRDLSHQAKFLSIVTNGQWKNPDIGKDLITSGINLIEISVDAGGEEMYEKSRPNASYWRLLANLERLKTARKKLKSKAVVKVRLMLRPSTRHLEHDETRFLSRYCDCVLPQILVKHPETDYSDDVYLQSHVANDRIPVCTVPFKDLQVRPDGRVPICPAKGCALDEKKQVFLGNVCDNSLQEMWNSKIMQEIRLAQRSREGEILQMCRNCHYG